MKLSPTIAVLSMTVGVVLVASAPALFAQGRSPVEVMAVANQRYEQGEYATAAQQYQQLADQGYSDTNLYYNLGNAYFKQDDLGRAIVNYLRASELSPRDGDVQSNLELARSQTIDQFDSGGDSPILGVSNLTRQWLTVSELGLVSLLLWFGTSSAFAVLIVTTNSLIKHISRYLSIGGFALTILSFLILLSTLYGRSIVSQGVIVDTNIDVVSGPGAQYITEFTLHSGAEVRLIENREGWSRLALPGGELQGWVPSNTLEAVDGRVHG